VALQDPHKVKTVKMDKTYTKQKSEKSQDHVKDRKEKNEKDITSIQLKGPTSQKNLRENEPKGYQRIKKREAFAHAGSQRRREFELPGVPKKYVKESLIIGEKSPSFSRKRCWPSEIGGRTLRDVPASQGSARRSVRLDEL